MAFSSAEKQAFLNLARAALNAAVHKTPLPDPAERFAGDFEHLLQKPGSAFVTLTKKKMLRGCIGLIESNWPLAETIIHMTVAAATEDPRFQPVQPEELKEITIEISVLTPLIPVSAIREIQLGRDGVLVRQGRQSGVFLPQVAQETGWDLETFLNELCVSKAGLPQRAWENPDTELYRFTAEIFRELLHK